MIIELKKKGLRQKYMFNLKGDNGEVVSTSEKYHNKQDALDTIEMIQLEAPEAKVKDLT